MGKKYFIMNTESLQSGSFPPAALEYMNRYRDQFIIVDESSKFKTNAACKEEKKSMRTQTIKLIGKLKGAHRCILTGTFMSKSPVNAFDQMDILKENYFDCNMFAFERRHVIMVRLPIGRGVTTKITEELWHKCHKALVKARKRGEWQYDDEKRKLQSYWAISDGDLQIIEDSEEYKPFKDVDAIIKRIEKDCMIVRKKDCYDIPDTVYRTVSLDLTKEMIELYKSLLKNGFTEDCVCEDTISLFHRFLDICNGYIPVEVEDENDPDKKKIELLNQEKNIKLEALEELIDEIGVPEHKVIVWSNRKQLLHDAYDLLCKEGYRVCLYDGDTTSAEKARIEDAFNKGELDIFVGNQHSGGYGLDFLKECTYSIFLSNDHAVETRHQAEQRAERGEFTEARTVIDVIVGGTIEDRVMNSLRLGKELLGEGRSDKELFELFDELPVF